MGQLSPTHYFLKRNFYDGLYCTAEKCEKDVRLLRACLDKGAIRLHEPQPSDVQMRASEMCVGSHLDAQSALRMLKNMHETMKNVMKDTGFKSWKSP